MDDEEMKIESKACELDRAISSLLQYHNLHANEWITKFVTLPSAWAVSLYLAFPPPQSASGKAPDVRFFALNLLLSKIRSDWSQLPAEDAQEIYEVLMRQLPINLENRMVGARLCLVVSSAAALAGANTCYDLVGSIVGYEGLPTITGPLALELLINLAEETLARANVLPWQVGECMQECSSSVLTYLQTVVSSPLHDDLMARVLVCLERWIPSGVTLSELHSDYSTLLKAALAALGSQNGECFQAAVATLIELISSVDVLPGREPGMQITISAILTHKAQFTAAMKEPTDLINKRARGLLSLVGAVGSAEPYLLARGGHDAAGILEWLVLGLRGGHLGLEGASMVAESVPKLAAVPISKRGHLHSSFFAGSAQAVMQSMMYPLEFVNWSESEIDEDEFYRFREDLAKDVLVTCFNELGTSLLSHIVQCLNKATTWQEAEVFLFAAVSVSQEVLATALTSLQNGSSSVLQSEELPAKVFLQTVVNALPGSTAVMQRLPSSPHPKLVETAARLFESYAEWAALDRSTLETSLSYIVGALYILDARSKAASAFKELCRAAAPAIASAGVLPALMGACEEAVTTPVGSATRILETTDRLAVIKGLASVAAALPSNEAESVLVSLATSSVSTVKALAGGGDRADDLGPILAEALRVILVVIDGGATTNSSAPHPGLVILNEIWSPVNLIATHWAGDSDVSSAVCELWAITARKVGVALSGVFPEVVHAATASFRRHYATPCVQCLCDIVALTSQEAFVGQQVQDTLVGSLLQLSEVVGVLNQMTEPRGSYMDTGLHTMSVNGNQKQGAKMQQVATAGLQAICQLGRTFLQHQPAILLTSPSFSKFVYCALGCVRRREVPPGAPAVKFLAEAVMGLGYTDDEGRGSILWQLSQEMLSYVDAVVSFDLSNMVEVVFKAATAPHIVAKSRDAIADVLYGLCFRYGEGNRAALLASLKAPDFPARPGVLLETSKNLFVTLAVGQPTLPRRRFQELVSDFTRVCQGQMPADVLEGYQ